MQLLYRFNHHLKIMSIYLIHTVPTSRAPKAKSENGRTNFTRNPVLVSASNKTY